MGQSIVKAEQALVAVLLVEYQELLDMSQFSYQFVPLRLCPALNDLLRLDADLLRLARDLRRLDRKSVV